MSSGAELVVDCRNALGEMPLWEATGRRLMWIDVPAGKLFVWDTGGARLECHQFEGLLTGLAGTTRGSGLLLAGAREIWELGASPLRRRTVFTLPEDEPGHRLNDGAVDQLGRFWVGSMPNNFVEPFRSAQRLEPTGNLFAVCADGTHRRFPAALACPNAICWSPDSRTLYVADSVSGWIYAHDFDLETGSMGARRGFCRLDGLGMPDGAAVDVRGYLWNARWGAGALACISPDGQLERIVRLPVTNPTACCFGGPDLNVLYITSARYGLSDEQLNRENHAGGVFAFETETPGLVVGRFACGS